MRNKIKELYERSTLVAKIRYSYLCLLVPFVLFLIFCFYNLWNNNRRYEDQFLRHGEPVQPGFPEGF